MPAGVIKIFDVVDLKGPVSIAVDLRKSPLDELPPLGIQLAPDGHEELVDVEGPVVVRIEDIENQWHVLLVNAHLEVLADLGELVKRDALGAIVIHDGEELLQADDTAGPAGLDLVPEELDKLLRLGGGIRGPQGELRSLLALHMTSPVRVLGAPLIEEDGGELLVVKGPVSVAVIEIEDVLALLNEYLLHRFLYLFFDDDANLLYSAIELVEGHLALVMYIEELECLGHEAVLALVGRALLG